MAQLLKAKQDELDLVCDQNGYNRLTTLMESFSSKPIRITKSGWEKFDSNMGFGGFTNNIIYVLAYSGVGKTFWITNLINKLTGSKILFFSMEMAELFLTFRLLMPVLKMHYEDIHDYYLNNKDEFYKAVGDSYLYSGLFIDYKVRHWYEMEYIIDKIRPEFVLVDYLQWMTDTGGLSENESIKKNCQELARFSKDYECNVIVLTQLRKEQQDGKREKHGAICPLSSQAYGSTFIRNTADYEFALWRPDINIDCQPFEKGRLYCRCIKSRFDVKHTKEDVIWTYDKTTSVLEEI